MRLERKWKYKIRHYLRRILKRPIRVVYISGPYYSYGNPEVNLRRARGAAVSLWERGFAVVCPHLNTSLFHKDCNCKWEQYIRGDLEIQARCDAIVLLVGWNLSKGAMTEYLLACEIGQPVFDYEDAPSPTKWSTESPFISSG